VNNGNIFKGGRNIWDDTLEWRNSSDIYYSSRIISINWDLGTFFHINNCKCTASCGIMLVSQ
jgi:hypothetical protein